MSATQSQAGSESRWQWENATAGAVAGFATVAAMHPLDVVRTSQRRSGLQFSNLQEHCSRRSNHCSPRGTLSVIFLFTSPSTIFKGLKGLYAGFFPAVLGSTVSWGLYFFFYGRAKERYSKSREGNLSAGLHLASAAEAGALVCLCTNPIWLVKTRLQLQTPLHQTRPYSGLYGAFKTILREEGWRALYKGLVPGLFLVSHGAIQFTTYEELRKIVVDYKSKGRESTKGNQLNSIDYAVLGGSSKVAAIIVTYPFQVIRSRLQQRPSVEGIPRYMDSWHVMRETLRFEGFRGFYKGITPSLLKNVPASSITFIVYENVLKLLKMSRRND
ncbi:Folate transporter 1, chloroplastic [Turnera subulata]|uniref:Folate transporter 1, chloroplastic n=1 Tax=Turnera subulata TaxID=218843 RepID=A0A9Q0J094_9ROSI|nr:Folate transporter 1, chloroplastic [Turnera subulata]